MNILSINKIQTGEVKAIVIFRSWLYLFMVLFIYLNLHDITEIVLKVALNTINVTPSYILRRVWRYQRGNQNPLGYIPAPRLP
jgi:hypothetical protein